MVREVMGCTEGTDAPYCSFARAHISEVPLLLYLVEDLLLEAGSNWLLRAFLALDVRLESLRY